MDSINPIYLNYILIEEQLYIIKDYKYITISNNSLNDYSNKHIYYYNKQLPLYTIQVDSYTDYLHLINNDIKEEWFSNHTFERYTHHKHLIEIPCTINRYFFDWGFKKLINELNDYHTLTTQIDGIEGILDYLNKTNG